LACLFFVFLFSRIDSIIIQTNPYQMDRCPPSCARLPMCISETNFLSRLPLFTPSAVAPLLFPSRSPSEVESLGLQLVLKRLNPLAILFFRDLRRSAPLTSSRSSLFRSTYLPRTSSALPRRSFRLLSRVRRNLFRTLFSFVLFRASSPSSGDRSPASKTRESCSLGSSFS